MIVFEIYETAKYRNYLTPGNVSVLLLVPNLQASFDIGGIIDKSGERKTTLGAVGCRSSIALGRKNR